MLTKIKQFLFYLGYELSLFQKAVLGILGVAVIGFLGMQATGMVATISGSILKGSVTEEPGEAARPITLSILSVDRTEMAAAGKLTVKYTLDSKPTAPFKFSLLVTSEETEIGKSESESEEQSGIATVQIDEAHRGVAALTVRVTAEGGGQSASDTVTLLSDSAPVATGGIPATTSSGSLVPTPTSPPLPTGFPGASVEPATIPQTGSGGLPPGFGGPVEGPLTGISAGFPTGTGSLATPPPAQCSAAGKTCTVPTDCCSQRCAVVNVGEPKAKVCLPKR